MRRLFVSLATVAFVLVAAPALRAAPAPAPLEGLAQSLPDEAVAYAKKGWKGGKGWKMKGWKGKKMRRHGPPPWAPAHGLRRKRGW